VTYVADVIQRLAKLIEGSGLPMPKIVEAYSEDICDVTEAGEIRVKSQKCDPGYHAAHVFGHWVCDLHTFHEEGAHEDHRICDRIADIIAEGAFKAKQLGDWKNL
jgi:hypothetical protein